MWTRRECIRWGIAELVRRGRAAELLGGGEAEEDLLEVWSEHGELPDVQALTSQHLGDSGWVQRCWLGDGLEVSGGIGAHRE